MSYEVELAYTDSSGQHSLVCFACILQVYTKAAARVLDVSITCVSCRDTNQFSVTSSQVIKLAGGCADCPLADTVYHWTVTRSDGVPLRVNLATTTTGADRRNLVVRSSVVAPGYAYRSRPRSVHLRFFSTAEHSNYSFQFSLTY